MKWVPTLRWGCRTDTRNKNPPPSTANASKQSADILGSQEKKNIIPPCQWLDLFCLQTWSLISISCKFTCLVLRRSTDHWGTPGQPSNTWEKVNRQKPKQNTRLIIGGCFSHHAITCNNSNTAHIGLKAGALHKFLVVNIDCVSLGTASVSTGYILPPRPP